MVMVSNKQTPNFLSTINVAKDSEMKTFYRWVVGMYFFASWSLVLAQATTPDIVLLPASPTSADHLKLSLKDNTCRAGFKGEFQRVGMSQNVITVSMGVPVLAIQPGLCPLVPREEISIGQLPAGSYNLAVNYSVSTGAAPVAMYPSIFFTVTDSRVNKAAPYVRLDYSGHWWDPNDSGWGLFIWQDARSPTDSLLAAWFTYAADGKPNWYVFQPAWQTSTATQTAPLANSTRLPGATSPPPTAGTPNAVGTASLDFTNFGTADEGKITYTFTGGQTLTRTIQRFRP